MEDNSEQWEEVDHALQLNQVQVGDNQGISNVQEEGGNEFYSGLPRLTRSQVRIREQAGLLHSSANVPAASDLVEPEPSSLVSAEFVPAPHLGEGWTMKSIIRKNGKSAGQVDKYWKSPTSSNTFRSMKAVRSFMRLNEANPSSPDRVLMGRISRRLKPSAQLRLQQSFEICRDVRQSDRFGRGVVAKSAVKKGDIFVDNDAFWFLGTPPSHLDPVRGEYIMYGGGYFNLLDTYSLMLNEARGRKKRNMKFKVLHNDHDGEVLKVFAWEFLHDVQVNEEILIDYYQNATSVM